jgi:hypothetical protein
MSVDSLAQFMDIAEILKNFLNAKQVIVTWFSVLTRGADAFERIELETSSTLFYALTFMLYMALVDVLLHIPLAAKSGTKAGLTFESVLLLETYIEYLAAGLILYGSMKLFGGKGGLQPCIAAYCLLTAYLPLASVLMTPMRTLIFPVLTQGTDVKQIVESARGQLDQLSAWASFGFLLSFLLTTVVFVVFLTAVFRTFRKLHKLNRARAGVALIVGLVCSAVVLVFIVEPLFS